MKVTLITDQHFGARNDSIHFLDFYEKFYKECFFPTLDSLGISTVLILGDTFDRRKYINFYSYKRAREMFFDKLAERDIQVYMLAGNHDTYFKNTNEVNSVDLLMQQYGSSFHVIDSPEEIYIGPHKICMMPWICTDNYDASINMLKNTEANICCGHFEIAGFAMYRGMPSEEGLSRELFRKFSRTFSGHYHHKSSADGITYLGNPYQLTWQDYGDQRGFHIFDIEKDTLEFIANPFEMFYRINYDDKKDSITDITNIDMGPYKDTYVKVVVINKTNPYLFDKFMNNLYNVNPADITIVEDFTDINEGVNEVVDQAEDTLTILNKYVDSVQEENIDNIRLKNLLKQLYVEAINIE